MKESTLSVHHMTAMLDNAPTAIYVSALDNWELLYANIMAKKLFLRDAGGEQATCYRAAGYDSPCPFCHVRETGGDEFRVRDFEHPINQRIYQLSGKRIDWDGRPAHIEYILDITDRKREAERSAALQKELELTFSSIPCGLCVYRFDGKTIKPVFHNPAFYEIMGYSEEHIEQIKHETAFLGVHPEDLDLLREKVQAVIKKGGVTQHTYRLWNDRLGEYRFLHLEGSVRTGEDGNKILYAVYSDVSEEKHLERELTDANEKMQDIVNAIPGGVAIYKVSDHFETVYFSDGVAALTGYTVEEYKKFSACAASEMTYWEDTAMVMRRAREVIKSQGVDEFEFRKQHRDGYIVWVRVQMKWIGEEDGCPLLHCVFHNISALKETELEMDHLVNSIPGGIASYRITDGHLVPDFFSDGATALTGHTREEYRQMCNVNFLDIIYEQDQSRVMDALRSAFESGEVLDISYRMRHKDGNLIWVHLNGRRMGPLADSARFYAVFTGMSAEARLFQNIANETADGIYVIDKRNYDLLYANESKTLFADGTVRLGAKCYAALHGESKPCEFCTLKNHEPDGEAHEMVVTGSDRYYSTRFRESDWNGIPAYVKYVRDVTDEVNTRREKERLEMYFQTVVDNLPGGIAVIRCEDDGRMESEFISDGFATFCRMSPDEAKRLYDGDAFVGVHPDDREKTKDTLTQYMARGEGHGELSFRMKRGDESYVWTRCMLSMFQSTDGVRRLYAVYTDISRAMEEKEQLRSQYEDLILQHYRTPGPNALIIGHCNITQNRILEIIDHTDSDLLQNLTSVREDFFTGLGNLVVDEGERQQFLNLYLNAPALAAFRRNDTEQILKCFIKLPKEPRGRYVQFKVNLVETPDTGDITGILTVTDITEQAISDRILHQLSVTGYDFVIDLNLLEDTYAILASDRNSDCLPQNRGSHSERTAMMLKNTVVPRDREQYRTCLDPDVIRKRLEKEGLYTFSFSIADENGVIRTKNMTVSAIDLRLGRVCLLRTDITDSMREQQGLLNMMAYTFELMGFIDVNTRRFSMYTRQTVLDNLSPIVVEDYSQSVDGLVRFYALRDDEEDIKDQFRLEGMLKRLGKRPEGYDFVFPYRSEDEVRYKQINVLWGDQDHRTVCMVRADVTDMLAAERQTKDALETALAAAEEANQAKSDFFSAMSHDIRTPMNAIMGMTSLAVAHIDEKERVADCLQKISISSKHLLSLINDVLDMSKIERSKITLNRVKIFLPGMLDQLSAMMAPQAKSAGQVFEMESRGVLHEAFYGDSLRINQILINLLSNALKFTPEGGRVSFLAEELPPKNREGWRRYRFTVSDTGIGMPEDFQAQIFAPFARSKNTARVEGTGLGLSITKGLVDLMDGEISVESQVNCGSTFRVELECEPAQEDEEDSRAERDGLETGGAEKEKLFAGRLFLVAEDNAINAEILCELLTMYGASAEVMTNGVRTVRAFERAKPGTYDAILMDIQMPEMNGYEATRTIRRMDRADAKTVPIIAMTANAFSEDIQAALEAGMNAHVAKPVDISLLRAALCTALGIQENGGKD